MITITETDTLVSAIMREAKLHNLVTKQKYHVYGLRRENNPVVLIEYADCYVDDDFRNRLTSLIEFFKLNGIETEFSNESDGHDIAIGLRIDLRKTLNKNEKPLLAASVLSTIVYCLEDRIDIEQMKKYKLSSIPKLPRKNTIDEANRAELKMSGRPGMMCEYGWWDKSLEEKILKVMTDNTGVTRQEAIVKVFQNI